MMSESMLSVMSSAMDRAMAQHIRVEVAGSVVTTIKHVTTTSRHGKYKDPEARKAYQRAYMAKKRAKSGE